MEKSRRLSNLIFKNYRNRLIDILVIVSLALVCVFSHLGLRNAGWRLDDGPHLSFIANFSPWQYFLDPEVIRFQSWLHFTPWNAFFYEIGVWFWGLNVTGHYVHILIIIWLTSIGTYYLLRIWAKVIPSAFGAAMFLVMPATGAVSQMLMTGHYAYGLLFSVLSFVCFSKAILFEQRLLSFLAAVFYLAACTCKELYPPIIALFFVVPIDSFRNRKPHLMWPLVAAFIYACFRLIVFPSVESYARPPLAGELQFNVLLNGILENIFGVAIWGNIFALLFSILFAYSFFTASRKVNLILAIVTLLVCVVPIFPMMKMGFSDPTTGRLLYFLSWTMAVTTAFLFASVKNTISLRTMEAMFGIVIAVGIYLQHTSSTRFGNTALEAEYKFLSVASENEFLLPNKFEYVAYLESMRNAIQTIDRKVPPTIIRSESELSEIGKNSASLVFQWSDDCQCLTSMKDSYDSYLKNYFQLLDAGNTIQLNLKIGIEDRGARKVLSWKLECEGADTFELHLIEYMRYVIPPSGEIPFGLDVTGPRNEDLHFRVIAKSKNVWIARSPLLKINPSKSNVVEWYGKSSLK